MHRDTNCVCAVESGATRNEGEFSPRGHFSEPGGNALPCEVAQGQATGGESTAQRLKEQMVGPVMMVSSSGVRVSVLSSKRVSLPKGLLLCRPTCPGGESSRGDGVLLLSESKG